MGVGGVGLTCPGWHSRAAGVCQSRAVSPASGTRTADVGGTPDCPRGSARKDQTLAGLDFHKSPQGTLTATAVIILPLLQSAQLQLNWNSTASSPRVPRKGGGDIF